MDGPNEKLVQRMDEDPHVIEKRAKPSDTSALLSESEDGTEATGIGVTLPAASSERLKSKPYGVGPSGRRGRGRGATVSKKGRGQK